MPLDSSSVRNCGVRRATAASSCDRKCALAVGQMVTLHSALRHSSSERRNSLAMVTV